MLVFSHHGATASTFSCNLPIAKSFNGKITIWRIPQKELEEEVVEQH